MNAQELTDAIIENSRLWYRAQTIPAASTGYDKICKARPIELDALVVQLRWIERERGYPPDDRFAMAMAHIITQLEALAQPAPNHPASAAASFPSSLRAPSAAS